MNAATVVTKRRALFERKYAVASVGSVALVSLMAFEATAVATAMPAIAAALDGLALYALAFGGAFATSVLGMVLAGGSCDRHGPLRATCVGLVLFTCGLMLAGFADSMTGVVVGRAVQGLGSGMLGVVLYAGMGQLLPGPLHPRLFAMLAWAWVLPALVGPLLAAWLVDRFAWRAVFLVAAAAAPMAGALLIPAFARLSSAAGRGAPSVSRAKRIGWALLGATGVLLLHVSGFANSSALRLAALVIGLILAWASAYRLLPRGSLVAAPGLPSVIALRGLLAAAFASVETFLPAYLTRVEGWTLTQAGLILSIGALSWSFGSGLQGRIVRDRWRQRGLKGGFVVVAVGMVLITTRVFVGHSALVLGFGWALAGFGIGLSFPMLSVLTLGLSPQEEQGRSASALQMSDAMCTSAVLALAGALFLVVGGAGAAGFALVLVLATVLALVGAQLAAKPFVRHPS
jgi:MFS family permease